MDRHCGINRISFSWHRDELCLVKLHHPVLIYLSVVVLVLMGRISSRPTEGTKDERVNVALTDGAAFSCV